MCNFIEIWETLEPVRSFSIRSLYILYIFWFTKRDLPNVACFVVHINSARQGPNVCKLENS